MDTKVYKNQEVILYLFEKAAGDAIDFDVLDDFMYGNDRTLTETPRFTVNKVVEGEVTVEVTTADGVFTAVANPDTPMPSTTYVGKTRFYVSGNGALKAFCFSRRDKRILNFAEAPVLEDGEEFTLHSKGYLTVGSGAILIGETQFLSGALIKVETLGTKIKALGKTFLAYIGEPV